MSKAASERGQSDDRISSAERAQARPSVKKADDIAEVYGPPPAEFEDIPHPKRHNLEPFRDSSKTRVLRLWLNIIFMVAAIVGLLVYFYTEEKETAKWIMLGGCVFKFVELALRILKI